MRINENDDNEVDDDCCPFWLKIYKSNYSSFATASFDSEDDLEFRYEVIDDGSEQV